MDTEFEVKFLNIEHQAMRVKLAKFGAKLQQPMRLMKRAIIQTPELKSERAFLRVRDEGDKVTLTYKQFQELSIDGAKEHEITVNDFDKTVDLLSELGLKHSSLQESKRETWTLDSAEVVLDEWPWLNPYIEIEGDSEQHVKQIADKLGFNWDDAVFGGVDNAYQIQYPHLTAKDTIANIPEVKFDAPIPKIFTLR